MMSHSYIPALRFRFLTPLYDPLLRWGMREVTFKRRLIEQAKIKSGFRVLDLGCGTGTLTILVKQMHPDAEVIGIDGDPRILAIARAKAEQQKEIVTFDEGLASQLPYRDNSFDIVLSSLVIHHLTTEDKQRAFCEAFRILRPGGEMLVVDFGAPHNSLAGAISLLMRHLERAEDNILGKLPAMFSAAGFNQVQLVEQFMSIVGTLTLYRGMKAIESNAERSR